MKKNHLTHVFINNSFSFLPTAKDIIRGRMTRYSPHKRGKFVRDYFFCSG